MQKHTTLKQALKFLNEDFMAPQTWPLKKCKKQELDSEANQVFWRRVTIVSTMIQNSYIAAALLAIAAEDAVLF